MHYQEHIDEIMDNFDFNRVKEVMDALSWRWAFTSGVPEILDIRKLARKCLKEAAEYPHDTCYTGTGGFSVGKEDGFLSLNFVITEFDTSYMEPIDKYGF